MNGHKYKNGMGRGDILAWDEGIRGTGGREIESHATSGVEFWLGARVDRSGQ